MTKVNQVPGSAPSASPEYQAFSDMLNRCYRPKTNSYKTHGARGIRVCRRWRYSKHGGEGTKIEAFLRFMEDMGPRPEDMTLERKDVLGNYTPENCCWATMKRQANNRRNTLLVTIHGVTKLLSEWAEHSGVSGALIRHRLMAGWPAEQAIRPTGQSGTREMDVLGLRLWRGKRAVDDHPATSRIAD